MLSQESVLKRLTIVKYLYQIGVAQSQLPETMSFTSILSFQDAIEIFLKLVAEKRNMNTDNNYPFMRYWDDIPTLTLKESIRNLNTRRVNLKHRGILPARQDIEVSRVNVSDFFAQNVMTEFNMDFTCISLVDLITFPTVRKYAMESEKAYLENNMSLAVENSAKAFAELLEAYESPMTGETRQSPFFFGTKGRNWMSSQHALQDISQDLARDLDSIKKSIHQLQQSAKITSMGLDYRKYAKFKILTPEATKVDEGYFCELWGNDRKWTSANVQFCIDFVIECSLKLQDFNFDLQSLVDDQEFTLEYVSGNVETGLVFRQVPIS